MHDIARGASERCGVVQLVAAVKGAAEDEERRAAGYNVVVVPQDVPGDEMVT
ncbi:hypothetical protein E2C01_061123 [Portunus trituberculatus]|uniref:Uncharacterized protein n=1 Tax=Portunus trituberculatus TaxID=210409 RepID=A0A5B7HE74_PORTR|nr:hypothetical protein [Portunus trituberculatus]